MYLCIREDVAAFNYVVSASKHKNPDQFELRLVMKQNKFNVICDL